MSEIVSVYSTLPESFLCNLVSLSTVPILSPFRSLLPSPMRSLSVPVATFSCDRAILRFLCDIESQAQWVIPSHIQVSVSRHMCWLSRNPHVEHYPWLMMENGKLYNFFSCQIVQFCCMESSSSIHFCHSPFFPSMYSTTVFPVKRHL